MSKNCYATLIRGDKYARGAICLDHCLKKANSQCPLIVMICDGSISEDYYRIYDLFNINYINIPNIRFDNKAPEDFDCTINKFYVYNLLDYDKVCFLDSDIIVVENIDHFFDLPIPYGFYRTVPPDPEHEEKYITGGCFIIETRKDRFDEIVRTYGNKRTDEEVLIDYAVNEKFTLGSILTLNRYTIHWYLKTKYWQHYDSIEPILNDLDKVIDAAKECDKNLLEYDYTDVFLNWGGARLLMKNEI